MKTFKKRNKWSTMLQVLDSLTPIDDSLSTHLSEGIIILKSSFGKYSSPTISTTLVDCTIYRIFINHLVIFKQKLAQRQNHCVRYCYFKILCCFLKTQTPMNQFVAKKLLGTFLSRIKFRITLLGNVLVDNNTLILVETIITTAFII